MFASRADAGRQLGRALRRRGTDPDLVLALPRGGVPVAHTLTAVLGIPLAVATVSSPDVPVPAPAGRPVRARGNAAGDRTAPQATVVGPEQSDSTHDRQPDSEDRSRTRLDEDVSLAGKHVLIVDDGVVTGSKQLGSIQAARESGADPVSLAVPVGPPETVSELDEVADEVVCLELQRPFGTIEEYYDDAAADRDETVRVPLSQISSVDQ